MELIQAPPASVPPQLPDTMTWISVSPALPHSPLLLLLPPTPSSFPAASPAPLDDSSHNDTWRNSSGGGDPGGFQPSVAGVLIPVIYAAVCVVGLVGNTLVIHIVLHYTRSESVTNIYILNLAIADELFMLGLPFLAVQNALLSWPFGSLMCRVVMTVDAINQFTSIFCLTVMSIDRYLAVVHPVRSSWWRRPRVAKAVNATVWAVSFVVVLPVVVFANVLKDDGNCSIVWPEPAEVWKTSFIVYTSTVGFLCPLLVICLCYLLIVVKVRSSGKRVRVTSSRRRKSERKITRMVVVVVAVFVLCWLPFYVLNIVNLAVILPGEFRGLYFFVVVLSYANSCANPILYGFLSDNFKRGFRKALCRSSRRVDHQERAGTEMQRPTEEWGGAPIPQAPSKLDGTEDQGREQEEEVEEEKGERMTQQEVVRSTETCRRAQNRSGEGAVEGSRTLFGPPAKIEVVPVAQGAEPAESVGISPSYGAGEAVSAMANGAKSVSNRRAPKSPDSAVLEISHL